MPIIQETLDAKLPALLEQFPSLSEEFVRVVAQADPTGCRHVGWLLRMLEDKQWEIMDAESVRSLLDAYDRLKDVEQWQGQPSLEAYASLRSLTHDLQQHIETHEIQDDENAQSKPAPEGAKQITSAIIDGQTVEVWQITTPEAAALFARGQGGSESPTTEWATRDPRIAAKYLVTGPLYVVLDNGNPFCQVHFGRHEARNPSNLDTSAEYAAKIAPLFTGQNFAADFGQMPYRPGGWQLTDTDIDNYLQRLKLKFVAQRKAGFYLHGKWIEPISDHELLERRWKAKEPAFQHALKMAQTDHDEEIISKAGRKHPEPKGLQALANAVYELEHV